MSKPAKPVLPLRQYRRAAAFLRPYAARFLLLFGIGLISTALTLAQPYFTKLLIDDGLLRRNMHGLWMLAGWMAITSALAFVFGIITTRAYTQLSAKILFDMRSTAFRRLQLLSPQYFAKTKTGDIVSRLNNDIGELQRLTSDTLLSLPSNVLFFIGSAGMMLFLDVRLFLISIGFLPVGIWAMRLFQGRLRDQVRQLREQSSGIGSFLIEAILGMRVVVCSNAQERTNKAFEKRNGEFVDSLLKMQVTSFLAGAFPGAVLTLAVAGLFLVGGSMVVRGSLTIGGLMAFMAYYSRLLSPVQSLMGTYSSLIQGSVCLERVYELLDARPEVTANLHPVPLTSTQGKVEFEHVSFAYGNRPVLHDLSFSISPRSICLLVGHSGSGKSTTADLLLRFYDPADGRITLDSIDIRTLSFADLRRAVAVVEQTPFLFHTTIRENLLFAAPESSQAEYETAARSAGIHDFIETLPEGYETIVGERGLTLSAGQRQRLAIARALLRNPSVLILDEPSAALDPTAEYLLGKTLQQLTSRCTILVITHRPALVSIAGHVVVLDKGRAIEEGDPRVLLSDSELSRHFRLPEVEAEVYT